MKPSNYIHYKNGKAVVKYEHTTLTYPERNYGTGTTIFWQTYRTGWEAVEALTEYCEKNGIENVEKLGEDWKKYYDEMDAHVLYMEANRPKESEYSAIGCSPNFKQALSKWEMAYSCDAPNKPGYYRANND